jgi:hypothetical protein
MKPIITRINLLFLRVNPEHLRLIMLLVSLGLFMLGAGAPEAGGEPGG